MHRVDKLKTNLIFCHDLENYQVPGSFKTEDCSEYLVFLNSPYTDKY